MSDSPAPSAPKAVENAAEAPPPTPTAGDDRIVGEIGSRPGGPSAEPQLRSARFRKEREASWRRLEALLGKLERSGPSALTPQELLDTPQLYRSALSSLSVARAYVFDAQLVAYLESLATRAHFLIYAPRERFWRLMARLLMVEVPRAVRLLWAPILIAAAIMALGIFVGRAMVLADPSLYAEIMPDMMAQGRSPQASRETMLESISGHALDWERLSAFALFLFDNNAGVALLAFGLGVALGLPTMLLLFVNGLFLGAMLAAFASHGLETAFIGWLTVHGTTELTAIIIAGGGGLAIAQAMLFPPPRRSRLAAAAEMGRQAGLLALLTIVMLFVAAILEAFVRDTITDWDSRVLIGLVFGALWLAYFIAAGRPRARRDAKQRPMRSRGR